MCNRQPVLLADLKYGLNSEPAYLSEPFNKDVFEGVLSTANILRDEIHEAAGRNTKKVQAKQKRDFDHRDLTSSTVDAGNKEKL